MTTYGTIPTSQSLPSSSPNLEFLTRTKHKIQSSLIHTRPWTLLLSFSLPPSFSSTFTRIRTNLSFFRMNYAIISLFILFLSLLWHPISLIVFTLTLSAWLFLYFLRDTPLLVCGYSLDDRLVLAFLAVLTVVLLMLTDVTVNIVVAIAVAVGVVLLHAVVRRTEDLPLDEIAGFEDENGARVVFNARGNAGERLPLKDTASASFSG